MNYEQFKNVKINNKILSMVNNKYLKTGLTGLNMLMKVYYIKLEQDYKYIV